MYNSKELEFIKNFENETFRVFIYDLNEQVSSVLKDKIPVSSSITQDLYIVYLVNVSRVASSCMQKYRLEGLIYELDAISLVDLDKAICNMERETILLEDGLEVLAYMTTAYLSLSISLNSEEEVLRALC